MRHSTAVAYLDLFRRGHGCAQAERDVIREVLSAESHRAGMLDGVIGEHGDVAGAAAEIHDCHAYFSFLICEDGF